MKVTRWGFLTAAFYIVFVIVMVSVVVWSTGHRVDLVDEDYYDKELAYQDHIDKLDRTNRLKKQPEITYNEDLIVVKFPDEFEYYEINGKINYFRPSDKDLDFTEHFEPDSSNIYARDSYGMAKGWWRIKLDWEAGDSTYYNEQEIFIN
jgi:hypothetical protein